MNHIYIAGQNSSNQATLWITDLDGSNIKEVILDNTSTYAQAVAVSSGYAYSVGQNVNSHETLWITNLKDFTTQTISLEPGEMGHSAGFNPGNVALSSSEVYIVAESFTAKPTLWITDLNGGNIQTNLISSENSNPSIGAALSNHVYSSGYTNQATLWITNLNGSNTQSITLSDSGSPISVAVSPKNVYTGGQNSDGQATLWITSLKNLTTQTLTLDAAVSAVNGIALSLTNIYSVGIDSTYRSALWITSLKNLSTKKVILDPAIGEVYHQTGGGGVSLSSNYAYSVLGQTTTNQATLWITDLNNLSTKTITLDSGYSKANGIASLTPQSNSLLQTINNHSPLSPLKGVRS